MFLIIVLTFLLPFYGQPYVSFFFSGLLMILFTFRSFYEKENILVNIFLLVLCACFSVFSHNFASFLIFYEADFKKFRYIKLILPSVCYMIYRILSADADIPRIIFIMLILAFLSVLIYILEKVTEKYLTANLQKERSLRATAVSELYQRKLNRQLEFEKYLTDKNARFEERENISRSIHNCVGHSITAAIMTLDAADMLFEVSPQKAREKMNIANERMRTSLDSVRQAVRLLDTDEIFISMYDFTESIKNICGSFDMDTATNTAMDFSGVVMESKIPRDHAEFLTGAVEETLSNGVRHGNADRFNIIVTSDSRHIMLIITDNGSGNYCEENSKEKIQHGFGLKKLISYTNRCGGRILFSNQNGFRTEIILPFQEPENTE